MKTLPPFTRAEQAAFDLLYVTPRPASHDEMVAATTAFHRYCQRNEVGVREAIAALIRDRRAR